MTQRKVREIPKAYDPAEVEQRLYQFWQSGGYFNAKTEPGKEPFVIIMPPPNITGELHLGHALTATLEDIMTRWHRMRGDSTLWLPGVDHAGIATQVVVERELAQEGLTRYDLGRERFVERLWEWVRRYRHRIDEQLQRLGASCDWEREQFTLDPGPNKAVRHTFVRLYQKGLIYRGERIINWCPRCATALSDLEVEHQQVQGNLYYIRYPWASGSGFVTVATTRPETMLGDTAVAVNPEDDRYRHLVGQQVVLPILNRPIPVVADAAVDPDFGTGALKITPGHDPTDFEVGQRQGLPIVNAMNLDGTMSSEAGPYQGMDRYEARKAVVEELKAQGLLERIEPYQHAVGHCQRCDEAVEPLVSKQWFVKMAPLARPALEVVKNGTIRIIPERFALVYENWMENIRDWCISRQLWWGHRIPVWHCSSCGGLTVEENDPSQCSTCGSREIEQDPDVLDTWFSSALWPHSTLGWPEETEDLAYFYPTSVMETSYDILFFWVARMIMMGLENTGTIPFHTVYLHGLVRDIDGQKMSKTRGNVVDPMKAIEKYGCDALRFALTNANAPGNDQRLSDTRLEAGRNFANKLWNAARFVLQSLDGASDLQEWRNPKPASREDRWILSRLNHVVAQVSRYMDEYQFGEAEQTLYAFLWEEYCDWYIEMAKVSLRSEGRPSPLPVLVHVLEKILRLLHPFIPFVTEEVWQNLLASLPKRGDLPESIVVAPYPKTKPSRFDDQAEEEVGTLIEVIRAVRNVRAEFRIPPQRPMKTVLHSADLGHALEEEAEVIKSLGRIEPLTIVPLEQEQPLSRESMTVVLHKVTVSIPMSGVMNVATERKRLERELAEAGPAQTRLEERLQDNAFLSKAPEQVVEQEHARLQRINERRQRIRELLSRLPE